MKVIVVIALVLALVSCGSFEPLLTQLREKVPASDYALRTVDLVELSLRQGSKVDQVVTLLEDILGGLRTDQSTDDMEHTNRMTQWVATIKGLERNLESLNSENANNNRALGELSGDLANFAAQIASLTSQSNLLVAKEQQLREQQAQEEATFSKRQETNARVLKAVEQIHQKLSQAALNKKGAFIELAKRDEIVAEIKKELGDKHPIALLVALTVKFDEEKVKAIIEKLEGIANAIRNSQEEDQKNKEAADNNFAAILGELKDLQIRFGGDLHQAEFISQWKQTEFDVCQRKKEELSVDIETTERLLLENRSQSESYDSSYGSRRLKRLGELETIEQALQLVQTHAEKLKAK